MDRMMYWKQPAPVAPQIPATGISVETGTSANGPWSLTTYVATIRPNNYWCEKGGATMPGDCFLLHYELPTGATHVRARSTAQVSGSMVYSEYSTPIAVPEPLTGLQFWFAMMLLMLLMVSRRK